ncbi:hypothetical protein BKA80DRAFT_130085 [Phyllosticta citrichinensis]
MGAIAFALFARFCLIPRLPFLSSLLTAHSRWFGEFHLLSSSAKSFLFLVYVYCARVLRGGKAAAAAAGGGGCSVVRFILSLFPQKTKIQSPCSFLRLMRCVAMAFLLNHGCCSVVVPIGIRDYT